MNPFNRPEFRGEQQLGNVYQEVRYLLQHLNIIQMLADNLENLRSGNIRLKTEENKLYWGYTADEEWFYLGDLATQADINALDLLIQGINQTLDNQNSLISTLQSSKSTHEQRLDDVEQDVSTLESFEQIASPALSQLQLDLDSLVGRVEILEAAQGEEGGE